MTFFILNAEGTYKRIRSPRVVDSTEVDAGRYEREFRIPDISQSPALDSG